jgi:hypothetical protein
VSGILVDTLVWMDHFRDGNDTLIGLLDLDLVLVHPLIIGELACGAPPSRAQTLTDLASLCSPPVRPVRPKYWLSSTANTCSASAAASWTFTCSPRP